MSGTNNGNNLGGSALYGKSMADLHAASLEDGFETEEDGSVPLSELARMSNLEQSSDDELVQFHSLTNSEEMAVSIPSFFSMPEAKKLNFSLDECLPTAVENDATIVSVNLDCELPSSSLKIMEEHIGGLKLKADLLDILNKTDFRSLDVSLLEKHDGLKSLDLEQLNDIITQLIFNKTVRDDKPLMQKLYKLKDIEELVNTSMNIDEVKLNFNNFLSQIKSIIVKYETIVKQEISSQVALMNTQSRNTDGNVIAGLKEQIRTLEGYRKRCETYEQEIAEYEKLKELTIFDECETLNEIFEKINTFKAFDELSDWDIFADCKSTGEMLLKIKSSFESDDSLTQFLEQLHSIELFADVKAEEIIEKISELVKQNNFYESLVQENEKAKKDDNDKITSLTEEVKKLKDENALLKQVPTVSVVQDEISDENKHAKGEALNEFDEEEDDIKPSPNHTNKMSLGKKIGIGVGAFFGIIILYFVAISFVSVKEEQNPATKKEFSNAIKPSITETKAPPSAIEPTATEVTVPPTPENKIPTAMAAIVEPTPVGYDFSAVLAEEVFKKQKFDIYVDDSRKVRINGKNFVSGETINGYKFIRTVNSGKILFMNEADGKSLWLTMN